MSKGSAAGSESLAAAGPSSMPLLAALFLQPLALQVCHKGSKPKCEERARDKAFVGPVPIKKSTPAIARALLLKKMSSTK